MDAILLIIGIVLFNIFLIYVINRIGGEMVSVLTLSAVDHGFELLSGQAKSI
jgi:hypothetical protein